MTIPGVLAGATVGNRWTPDTKRSSAASRRPSAAQNSSTLPPAAATSMHSSRTGDTEIRPMIPLGQFRDTFIIAVDDEGIAIIDQHVAHERVLFEQVMERLTAGRSRASVC